MPTNSSTKATSSVTPVNISTSGSGRVSSELSPDDCFFDWSADTCGGGRFMLADDNNSQSKKKSSSSSSSYSWGKKFRQFVVCQKIKSSSAYLKGLLLFQTTKSAEKRECFISKFPRVVGRKKKTKSNNPFGRIENYERFEYGSTLKKRIEKEMAEECLGFGGFSSNRNSISITNTKYISQQRKSFFGAIQCHVSSSSTKPSSSSSSSSSSFSLSSNKLYYNLIRLKKGGDGSDSAKEIESSIEGAIAHCKKS
ncbi:hypothetical protein LINGRAHAP2_LOCUS18076 [Linum grandiflorum]